MPERQKRLLLIDGTALVFRGFYAIPPLNRDDGFPTNAIYGFFTILLNVLLEQRPDWFVVCFDRSEVTSRKEEYAEYKATRTKAPDELYMQIDPIKKILKEANLHLVEQAGVEADDLIATLANKNASSDLETLIYSSDLDLLQLVNDRVKVLRPGNAKTGNSVIDVAKVMELYGLSPEQISDYKGLHGDSSDNLPGVKGVGVKTATVLIQQFGSLEGIYENLHQIKGKVKENLLRDQEQAFFCKRLATLDCNCEMETGLFKYKIDAVDFERFAGGLTEYSVSKLKMKVDRLEKVARGLRAEGEQGCLF